MLASEVNSADYSDSRLDAMSDVLDSVDIKDGVKPREEVTCEIKYKDGTSKTIKVVCRIDTQNEVEYYKNGGILQYVLRNMLN